MKVSAVARDFAPLNDGGKAEKHPHVPVAKHEVEAGSKVEREHTDSKTKARAIAVDHLVEIPDYYKRLSKLETEAKDEGKKRASMEPMKVPTLEGPTLEDQHAHELAEATEAANTGLQKKRILAEISAGLAAAPSMLPGVGLFLPTYDETRDAAMAVLHGHAQNEADALGALQSRQNATRVLNSAREQPKTAAGEQFNPLQNMEAAPRGDELHLPIGNNPYSGDQKQTEEYENGFAYAQARGTAQLNQATAGDVQRWQGNSPAWCDGFADAARKLGLGRVGDVVAASKTATILQPTEVCMTKILALDAEAMKLAMGAGMSTLLGAGLGAGLGGMASDLNQGAPVSGDTIQGALDHLPQGFGPQTISPDVAHLAGNVAGPLADLGQGAQQMLHVPDQFQSNDYDVNAALGGAGAGAALGYGLNRLHAVHKLAVFNLDTDSDVDGSAIDVLRTKHASIGSTLGSLGGIAGGAVLGHYAMPAMDWAVSPGESSVAANVAGAPGAPQDPSFVQGLHAGVHGASEADWNNMSNIGTVAGAGLGGITGHQIGRGIDQSLGLERRERPMVISPMAQHQWG